MSMVLLASGLQLMIDLLAERGYEVIGPTVRENVIVHEPIRSLDDLPRGVTDIQAPGRYRTGPGAGPAFFGFAAAATSWKPLLFPAHRPLWSMAPADGEPQPAAADQQRRAFFGVRSCDLHAMEVQDSVLARREFVDTDYQHRRAGTLIIAVTCGTPGGTCFCASMDTGPRPTAGYDINLTELADDAEHRFVAEAGSEAGAEILAALPTRATTAEDIAATDCVVAASTAAMGRVVDTAGIKELLYDNAEHPRWDEVASRCLSCTSCTMVCPTCFCVSADNVEDLTGAASRSLGWDSCFQPEHSRLHSGPVRRSTTTRYRQWLTHKFASWIDQFGTSGCVGCGRCITWCPAGIDITEELAAIRESPLGSTVGEP